MGSWGNTNVLSQKEALSSLCFRGCVTGSPLGTEARVRTEPASPFSPIHHLCLVALIRQHLLANSQQMALFGFALRRASWFCFCFFLKWDKEDFAFIFSLLACHEVSLHTSSSYLKVSSQVIWIYFLPSGRDKRENKIICLFQQMHAMILQSTALVPF